MERIKRFFWDETASIELTAEVMGIGLLAAVVGTAVVLYYTGAELFYGNMATWTNDAAGSVPPFPQ